jgi:23S rRNA G2445 N2-methylase RlmL
MRFFAHALPGLGPLLADEISEYADVERELASDGRNDVVRFELRGSPPELACAEDVFVEIGHLNSTKPLRTIISALSDDIDRALSVYASATKPLHAKETFRVVARVRDESQFLRSEFRKALEKEVADRKPRWVHADPASIEIWAAQTDDGWLAGIRLTPGPRSDREAERAGALRPSVAAAMVRLAGEPGLLVDPFCGSGTILAQARRAGWIAFGSDIDPDAVIAARANSGAPVVIADAFRAPYVEGFDAAVSNVPFGERYELPAPVNDMVEALVALVRAGGAVVVLTGRTKLSTSATIERKLTVRVLGQPATLWRLRRYV